MYTWKSQNLGWMVTCLNPGGGGGGGGGGGKGHSGILILHVKH